MQDFRRTPLRSRHLTPVISAMMLGLAMATFAFGSVADAATPARDAQTTDADISSVSSTTSTSTADVSSISGAAGTFSSAVPALPAVASASLLGSVAQNDRVAGRDGGDSAQVGSRSYWVFADTTLKNPWGFLSNSAAVTRDLTASDGINLHAGTPFSTNPVTPQTVIPHTAAETAFEAAHSKSKTGCTSKTDQYCGVIFGYWPGSVVADPVHNRVLVFFGKICRGGATGTPCTHWKTLGTGIAAINVTTGKVTRLTASGRSGVSSIEGVDRTLEWSANQASFTGSVVVDGVLYTRGKCDYWHCATAKVPLSKVTDVSAYRFWNGKSWGTSSASAVLTAAAGGTTFYSAALKMWINVSLPYGTQDVIYQVAGQPWGPFSASKKALTIPKGNGTNYSMFVHTEYAQDNGAAQYLTWYDNQSGGQKLARIAFVKP